MTLDDLRRMAATHTLFPPTTLPRAVSALGFVQADPIRAPARAQDLTLRHRVRGYRAGDLERRYPRLGAYEDFFVNYGFVTGAVHRLMHPRGGRSPWTVGRAKHVRELLEFVRARGSAHPRDLDEHFSHGTVTNYWGGTSSATTHMLNDMHYRGLLRVVRRETGIRVYGVDEHDTSPRDAATRNAHLDALVEVIVRNYAPLPAANLWTVVWRLRYGVPQWTGQLKAALQRAKRRLAHARVDGVEWYWPADARVRVPDDDVRLLTPFDPVVWDRRRFEMLWGWKYRFEAYTPAAKRKLGYYALPLLWRDRVVGWGNLSVTDGTLRSELGYVAGRPPQGRVFRRALEDELNRMRVFLGVE